MSTNQIPRIMGVLNVTPDSFSDGGRFVEPAVAIERALQMVEEGADLIDIGAESTRPGAMPIPASLQLERLLPVLSVLSKAISIPISIDTSDPIVMRETIQAGASMVNDVRALSSPGALEIAASLNVPICIMHMQGTPTTMQNNPQYRNVVEEVYQFLNLKRQSCIQAGISPENILIDPGFGFGKTLDHNIQLLRSLSRFKELGAPLVVGLSRKAMIGHILNIEVKERLVASVALAVIAMQNGANIIRVHDVKATVEACTITSMVL